MDKGNVPPIVLFDQTEGEGMTAGEALAFVDAWIEGHPVDPKKLQEAVGMMRDVFHTMVFGGGTGP